MLTFLIQSEKLWTTVLFETHPCLLFTRFSDARTFHRVFSAGRTSRFNVFLFLTRRRPFVDFFFLFSLQLAPTLQQISPASDSLAVVRWAVEKPDADPRESPCWQVAACCLESLNGVIIIHGVNCKKKMCVTLEMKEMRRWL